jgi:hypothetical protein
MQKNCKQQLSGIQSSLEEFCDQKPEDVEDTRNFKGYWFETFVCKPQFEGIPNILYECNPSSYEDWKHQQGNNPLGYDGVVALPNGEKILLEMKYRKDGGKVYHNWFARDWLTRDADIYVTNNVAAISYWDKRTLDSKRKKLMSPSEAVAYITRLVHRILHPNQYRYWNRLVTKLITITRTFFSRISVKNVDFRLNLRLENGLFKIVKSITPRLLAPQATIFNDRNKSDWSSRNLCVKVTRISGKYTTKDVSNHEEI